MKSFSSKIWTHVAVSISYDDNHYTTGTSIEDDDARFITGIGETVVRELIFFLSWCNRQQLWKAVITGDTVTRLSIPIWCRGKSPEEGQRWKFGRNVVK